ncbi:MAG: ABC transporter substrate-binding protein [Rhodocyclaceae bacterium]|nr:ABC transporter substrate-binding protein [Rhodocyclaceae bacterium]
MKHQKRGFSLLAGGLLLAFATLTGNTAWAETIRVAIGTQDTTINCAAGGILVRELKLLDKYLPRDGKYKDVSYDIVWKDFTSGAPLTNEMVAGKLDIGSMADFPGANNGVAHLKAGKKTAFITVLSGSTQGSGNGIVVPNDSKIQSIEDLRGKNVSVPFASTAHGMLLRVLKDHNIDPDKDLKLTTQSPEVAGSALKAGKIDAHADFVPFAELFPYRGFARKIYDGAQANAPTYHGTLANVEYAQKYPEIIVAYLRATIEANRLFNEDPEKYSELIAKVAGIDAEVNYLFHGPLGLQTRDLTWKPEYRQALATAIKTLVLLKRNDTFLDPDTFIDDRYIREAFKQSGLDYDKALKDYAKSPLTGKDARTGTAIAEPKLAAQLWVSGEAKVRAYATPESAFADQAALEKAGRKIRVGYVHDRNTGLKLFAHQAFYVKSGRGQIAAFLDKRSADAWARAKGGNVVEYAALTGASPGKPAAKVAAAH